MNRPRKHITKYAPGSIVHHKNRNENCIVLKNEITLGGDIRVMVRTLNYERIYVTSEFLLTDVNG